MKQMQPKLYFGHPINVYGTELEARLIAVIKETFPGWEIVNPGEQRHIKECERRKAAGQNAMEYFFKEVLPDCKAGVFLPFRDGKWGAGIVGEAKFLDENGHSIWQIDAEGHISRIFFNEVATLALSVEETRKRIRNQDGSRKPY